MSILMLFFSLCLAAKPQVVAVKAIDADKQSYSTWLSLHRELNSYLSLAESSLDSEKYEKKMTESFFSGKAYALKGKMTEAKEEFLSITEMALEKNWQALQQELIFHSFLYLSEIASSPLEKKLWLKKAVNYLPWYLPKFESYSLATQILFKKIRNQTMSQKYVWRPFERFSKFDIVLVNGNRFDIGPETEITLGIDQYRLTFISHDVSTQTKLVQSESINSMTVPEDPLVDGSCEAPKANLPDFAIQPNTSYVVYFNKHCIRQFDGQNWSEYRSNLDGVLPKYELGPNHLSSMNFAKEEESRNKRWKWIGASVLAATIGYAIYDHNRPTEVRQVVTESED